MNHYENYHNRDENGEVVFYPYEIEEERDNQPSLQCSTTK